MNEKKGWRLLDAVLRITGTTKTGVGRAVRAYVDLIPGASLNGLYTERETVQANGRRCLGNQG